MDLRIAAAAELHPGAIMAKVVRYGRWTLVRPLSEGGQAHTYLVESTDQPGEHFVLKRLKNPDRLGRFQAEVDAGMRLQHELLVQVLDADLECHKPWFVMEYCSNGPLQYHPTMPVAETLLLFERISTGVAFAHANGVVHRDIKPDNIFTRRDGSPAVGDFGLCFLADDGERFTFSHEAVGPRWYMAPELEDGRLDLVTRCTDVYSLGKLLYWMLTGRTFSREKHHEPDFDITAGSKSSVPFLVYELLDTMIVRDPAMRLADAGQVCNAVGVLRRRIGMGAHAIGKGIPQPCGYCGIGNYQFAVHHGARAKSGSQVLDVANFGFKAVGNPKWIISVCDNCGNVQIFRPDYAKDPDVWIK